ncbi:1059_t:CDS:2 [Rhizophagus irregularis]|nr:1059_t:CDS:2 [Rhizophagus irregularis]
MMNSRFIVFSAFLLVLISMILSVSAAPVPRSEADINDQDVLLTDAIPVTSNGGDLKPYNKDDEVDQKVVDDGNESQGDGKGLKI